MTEAVHPPLHAPSASSRWRNLLLLLLAVLLGAGALYWGSTFFSQKETKALATVPVVQGEFLISLKLKGGELEAIKAEQITAPPIGRLKIVKLWPEGEKVEVGDVVIQFDPAEYQKQVTDAEQAVEAAKAELEKTKANQQVEISRQEADIENQKAQLRLSQLQVEKMKFEASIQKEESKLNARKTELALEQAQKKLETQKVVNAAELKKIELDLAQKERQLEKARKDLESLNVRAVKPGMVVYQKVWKGGNRPEKIRVGDEIWGGASLITLPDLTRMQVKTFVNEVEVDKLKVGQKVVVKLDALPEPTFHGAITSIATLGREKEGEKNVKVFDVTVGIDEEDSRLKPGMSATSEVVIETIPPPKPETPGEVSSEAVAEAKPLALPLYIPLDAVFEKEGKAIVYCLKNGEPEAREVKLGKKNENYVIVEEGLSADDRITLRDPTLSAGQPSGQESGQQAKDQGVKIQ